MQGRAAEAISCYEHVALLQPESPEAHANLASAYKDAARQDTAIQRYQQVGLVSVSRPDVCCLLRGHFSLLLLLLLLLLQHCLPARAAASHQQGLDSAYEGPLGAIQRADAPRAQALALRPDFPEAFANLVHSLQCICDWTNRPDLFARLENEVTVMQSVCSHNSNEIGQRQLADLTLSTLRAAVHAAPCGLADSVLAVCQLQMTCKMLQQGPGWTFHPFCMLTPAHTETRSRPQHSCRELAKHLTLFVSHSAASCA